MTASATADEIIARLDLQPHPEGGWYRETWRAPTADGERGAGTSILFLLKAGQRSHWHRVDASEVWLHQAGGPLTLLTSDGARITEHRLGPDILAGDELQAVVHPHQWQAAQAHAHWTLVACVVAPAFDFAGFEMAPPDWEPSPQAPRHPERRAAPVEGRRADRRR